MISWKGLQESRLRGECLRECARPSLLCRNWKPDGKKEDYINWAWESARVRGEKAALAWEIAEREQKILKELDYENGYSLYVGIPFCPSVCSYCSFSSGPLDRWKEKVDAYVDALCKELEFIAERSKKKN